MSVVKRHWRRFLVAALVLIVGAALLLWSRPAAQAKLEALDLDDGGHATLAEPGEKPRSRVVVIAAPEQQLNDAQMLNLAHDSAARVIQYFPPENGDCRAQQSRLEAVIARLGGKPNLVAGIGPGSTTAWRWLASQDDDKAKALSVGFDIALAERDCDAPLPHQASHGQWLLAWNDNPDDDTAVFVRKQSSAETSISDYDTPLSDVLAHQLRLQLQGNAEALPVLEVPAAQPSDIVTLFYSGDGGWRDLDKDSAEHMASMGYPVVGIDTLRYYWQHKSPEQSAADLSKLMQHYREKWGAKRFVLAGYSFGADILPAIYNRLPGKDQQQVKAMLLLALARTGSFEIEVEGWLGKAGEEAATGPEMARLPAAKVFCIYGAEEKDESGCTQSRVGHRRSHLARPTHCMPPCMIGCSTPKVSVKRVLNTPMDCLLGQIGSQENTSGLRARSMKLPRNAGMPCSAMLSGVQPCSLCTLRSGRLWLIRKSSW